MGLQRSLTPQILARISAGELIVTLTPEAGGRVEVALTAGQAPMATGLAWFDHLNARYGVTRIDALFPHQPDLEAIKRESRMATIQ